MPEDENLYTDKSTRTWQDFVKTITKRRAYPQNEYEHGAYLIDSDLDWEDVDGFSQIVDKAIQLANISDDRLLRLEQTTAQQLVNYFDMARREPELRYFTLVRFYEWRNSILLTKAKNGNERGLQGAIGTKYSPNRSLQGYGAEQLYMEQPQEQNKGGGNLDFLKGLFPKRKQTNE